MGLFYKIAERKPDHISVDYKATALTKAVSVICTAAMLNAMVLPAAIAAENTRIQEQIAQNQAVAGQNAYEQLVNLDVC